MSAARTKRRKRKIQKNGLPEKVERVLELPVGSLSSAARIELMGNKRVIVDGCHGIVEYSDDLVRMQTGSGMIRFKGTMLSISCLTEDSAIIEGNILSLEYLS
ncbi:MAG: sporulation protein [Clostridiales bacterium]|jgi:sporulation protein YqfC|nr:sporulation protein [Clostridiales bacterium]